MARPDPVQRSLSFLKDLLADYHPRDFGVRFWDGTIWAAEPGQPVRFTLVLEHQGALGKMFWPPNEVTMSEAYLYGDCDIEGDVEAVFSLADYFQRQLGKKRYLRYLPRLLQLPQGSRPRAGRRAARLGGKRHSINRDRAAVTYHYDVPGDFFKLWLDRRMIYSCAYFETPDDNLDAAQERKLDYLCRKLRLHPGEWLLDIGCGWGGLVIHAAQHYGVQAVGVTLSRPQVDLANDRIREAGLADRCRVEPLDYRQVDEPEGYDKLVSVGMFEHVGEALLPEYFAQAWRLLRPGGVFLNHGIARNATEPIKSGATFSQRYVFPDGELVPVNTTLRAAEANGFEVRDVESLREHYMLTLRHWVRRLEDNHDQACEAADEVTYRVWRLFMSGSTYGFKMGRHNVYQVLLVKPTAEGGSGLPLSRADWYD
ncbi:MAG: class I SAM-dependent methyltransferase [Fidelibacterota bacterium]|nr:MAG: class I SAM-dependent methyltransferase [Candidatus Neomarinimicrobiota bacterium]